MMPSSSPTTITPTIMPTTPPPPPPSLNDYVAFHSMACAPAAAGRCIGSFLASGGHVLFLPFDYCDCDCDGGDGTSSSPSPSPTSSSTSSLLRYYECNPSYQPSSLRRLNLASYYALVLASFTGLSTILGCTKMLSSDPENVDSDGNGNGRVIDVSEPLVSPSFPYLRLHPSAFRYLLTGNDGDGDDTNDSAGNAIANDGKLVLKRQFEFRFGGVVPIGVVMWHIEQVVPSTRGRGRAGGGGVGIWEVGTETEEETTEAENGERILHLVEIYRVESRWMRALFRMLDRFLIRLQRRTTRPLRR